MKDQVFTVEYKLQLEQWQIDILNKRFAIGQKIYNALNHKVETILFELQKTKKWREVQENIDNCYSELKSIREEKAELVESGKKINKKEYQEKEKAIRDRQKEYFKLKNDMLYENKITKFGFDGLVLKFQRPYKKHIDSMTAYSLANDLWSAYEKLLFGNGRSVKYKKYEDMLSLRGATNASGIRVKQDKNNRWFLHFNKLVVPIIVPDKYYDQKAFDNKICFNRIVRRKYKDKWHYYLQICFKGVIPDKYDPETGELLRDIGNGRIGIYLGLTNVTVSKNGKYYKTYPLTQDVRDFSKEKDYLSSKMEASRHSTNPDNYEKNGAIKKTSENERLVWHQSNNYRKYKAKFHDIRQKESVQRKISHEVLANKIISLGNEFYINDLKIKYLKENILDSKANKNVSEHSPSMFKDILKRKLGYHDIDLIAISSNELNKYWNSIKKADSTNTERAIELSQYLSEMNFN